MASAVSARKGGSAGRAGRGRGLRAGAAGPGPAAAPAGLVPALPQAPPAAVQAAAAAVEAPPVQAAAPPALPEGAAWRYSEFITAVQSGGVERVRFSKDGTALQLTAVDGRRASVVLPNDPGLVDIL